MQGCAWVYPVLSFNQQLRNADPKCWYKLYFFIHFTKTFAVLTLSYLTLSYHHITYAILSSRLLLYLCYLMNRIVQQSGGKKYYVSVFITWGWQEGEHKRRSCALRIVLPPKKNISLYEKIRGEEHNYHTKQIFHSASSHKYIFPAYISYISDKIFWCQLASIILFLSWQWLTTGFTVFLHCYHHSIMATIEVEISNHVF